MMEGSVIGPSAGFAAPAPFRNIPEPKRHAPMNCTFTAVFRPLDAGPRPTPISDRDLRVSATLRAREWLSRSMIAVEAPGWRGATKAHTAVCN